MDYQIPVEVPNWEDVFEDPQLPLVVDIGIDGKHKVLYADDDEELLVCMTLAKLSARAFSSLKVRERCSVNGGGGRSVVGSIMNQPILRPYYIQVSMYLIDNQHETNSGISRREVTNADTKSPGPSCVRQAPDQKQETECQLTLRKTMQKPKRLKK
ncbi:hypothetical protein L1987_26335 [Smallanthus sonchifolius]|uniref:Uncharacterized protein n=1 Tax=Smallanthus sonchifolius TaxID=185202 RepID=A0ACB9IA48_9ASTR|nr:hypothetical protein L1987_26335 [Smallanthus sonchifolius]